MVSQQLRRRERLLALEARLPALLQGERSPASAAECLEYADLCKVRKLHAAAARVYAYAFAADPKLADNVLSSHRYNAACHAALAAAAKGADAAKLDEKEKARLRQKALAWLRADLALWTKILGSGNPPGARDRSAAVAALAGIRDAAWIVNLPADELRACRRLWADVAALLKRAGSPQ
jgi:hypothetical protein